MARARTRWDKILHATVRTNKLHISLPFDQQQDTEFNCGPECLRAILKYHGINIDTHQLELECGCSPEEGTTWDGLTAGARVHGLNATLREFDDAYSTIAEMKSNIRQHITSVVCLRAWGSSHFVVPVGMYGRVKQVERGIFVFYDPYLPVGVLGKLSAESLYLNDRFDTHHVLAIKPPSRILPLKNIAE